MRILHVEAEPFHALPYRTAAPGGGVQHVSFLLTALLFWWALVNPRTRQTGYGVAVGCLFVTVLHSGFLGVLLTVSRAPWYAGQAEFAAMCGLTALEDQQLAGLMMWAFVPVVYLSVLTVIFLRWASREEAKERGATVTRVASGPDTASIS